MYQALLAFVIFAQVTGSVIYPSQAKRDKDRGWRAATYRGLTIDKSTRADMLRVLGSPLSSVPSVDQDPPESIIWNDYGVLKGQLPGRLAVEVDRRTNRIVSIHISPDNMSKEEAIKHFGNDYTLMGYQFCEGLPLGADSGPVYEDPESPGIDYIEYRSRGIAILLDYQGKVSEINFVSEPIGLASKAGCKKEIESYMKKNKLT
jgi:hypothetical protein